MTGSVAWECCSSRCAVFRKAAEIRDTAPQSIGKCDLDLRKDVALAPWCTARWHDHVPGMSSSIVGTDQTDSDFFVDEVQRRVLRLENAIELGFVTDLGADVRTVQRAHSVRGDPGRDRIPHIMFDTFKVLAQYVSRKILLDMFLSLVDVCGRKRVNDPKTVYKYTSTHQATTTAQLVHDTTSHMHGLALCHDVILHIVTHWMPR